MTACSNLYFTCPNCDVLIRDTSDVNIYDTMKGKMDVLVEDNDRFEGLDQAKWVKGWQNRGSNNEAEEEEEEEEEEQEQEEEEYIEAEDEE